MAPSDKLNNTYGIAMYPGDNPNSLQDIDLNQTEDLDLVVGQTELLAKLKKSPLLETYEYYNSLPKQSDMPLRSAFNPTALSAKHLPNLALLERIIDKDGRTDFRFRVFGTALAAILGTDMTGKNVSEYPGKNRTARNFTILNAVRDYRQPISTYGQVISRNGVPILGDTLVLPFGEDSVVSHVLLELHYGNPSRWARSSIQHF